MFLSLAIVLLKSQGPSWTFSESMSVPGKVLHFLQNGRSLIWEKKGSFGEFNSRKFSGCNMVTSTDVENH